MAAAITFGEYEPEESPHPEDWVKVDFVFGIFIDGTLNNRLNTEARLAYEKMQRRPSSISASEREAASHYSPGGGFGLFGREAKRQRKEAYDNWVAGRPYDKDLAADYEGKDDSYENDLSNVARLYKHYEEEREERRFKVYTEGIGTTDYGSDDQRGYALGDGKVPSENGDRPDTGIIGKVRKNLEAVFENLQAAQAPQIGKITIDVFGFSRGAAAVRHLVHDITKGSYRPQQLRGRETVRRDHQGYPIQESQLRNDRLPSNGYLGLMLQDAELEVDSIVVRFAGLFDTVAHYGLIQRNDVGDLGLDSIRNAQTVIHLTAADEHRYNFDLDTIQSVGDGDSSNGQFLSTQVPVTRGLEKAMPGVHSDLGGGYREDSPEVKQGLFVSTERSAVQARKELLVSEGWFLENQLYISTAEEGKFILRSFRRHVSNQYSFIPLHFMCELAVTTQSVTFRQSQLERDYQFTPNHQPGSVALLQAVKATLRTYVFEKGPALELKPAPERSNVSAAAQAIRQNNTRLKTLRNHYLHWSADSGHRVLGIAPHGPMNSERVRDVHTG